MTVLQKDSLSKQEAALVKLFPSYEIQGKTVYSLLLLFILYYTYCETALLAIRSSKVMKKISNEIKRM